MNDEYRLILCRDESDKNVMLKLDTQPTHSDKVSSNKLSVFEEQNPLMHPNFYFLTASSLNHLNLVLSELIPGYTVCCTTLCATKYILLIWFAEYVLEET